MHSLSSIQLIFFKYMSGSLTKIHPYPKNLPVDTRISIPIHTRILPRFIIHGYPYLPETHLIFSKATKFFFFLDGNSNKISKFKLPKKKLKSKKRYKTKKKKKIHTIFHLKKKINIFFILISRRISNKKMPILQKQLKINKS